VLAAGRTTGNTATSAGKNKRKNLGIKLIKE
jgi:hypothetical protein